MSNGLLGKNVTVQNAYITPYAAPASGLQFSTVFINAVNTGGTDAKIRIGVTTSAQPNASEFIAFDIPLTANGGTYEYPCLIVHPGEKVMVFSDQANVAVRVHGLEQA